MTRDFSAISDLPDRPAIYVLHAGGSRTYVAYVGIAGSSLRNRIRQHFLRRDSSVTTGTSAVSLDPDQVCELTWWEHERFGERHALEAAELVAFELFEPTLRSRGGVQSASERLARDGAFQQQMRAHLSSAPAGRIRFPTLADAFARIEKLEARLRELENLPL